MNLEPLAEAFRRCSRFGGNMFVLAFFVFIAVILLIGVLSAVLQHHGDTPGRVAGPGFFA